ncbi:MAG: prepilin peptidase [Geminicoccaceae bacterium]
MGAIAFAWALAAALVGLAVGSFLGALASRWPALDRGFLFGRSRCAACGAGLGWRETLPLWSWVAQRGRCRHCGGAIGWRPLAAELAGAAIAGTAFAALAPAAALLLTGVGWCLLLLALIDAAHGRLPDILTLPLALAGPLVAALAPLPGLVPPLEGLLGAGLGFALFWAIGRLYAAWRGQEGLGLGDAKLLAAAGAWLGPPGLAPTILVAAITGLVAAWLGGRRRGGDAIAFGPFLALACWLLLLRQLAGSQGGS